MIRCLFVATYSEPVQIGEYEYKQVRTSRFFDYSEPMGNVIDWLKSIGVKNPSVNDFQISALDDIEDCE